MEVENNSSSTMTWSGDYHLDEHVRLPVFRFHPTDEELVGFYLKRKAEKRPISIELIKQVDIYKYDPWDLPKSGNLEDKEWYFFCKRGRKYRNSIRPNRVTGSGFWKATGIDKPIYSSDKDRRGCIIGLKKSLVYYLGFAGKGTKTEWMMHEFRLPPAGRGQTTKNSSMDDRSKNPIGDQEAEVWTLCRILKRNICYTKCILNCRDLGARQSTIDPIPDPGSKTCSKEQTSHSICFDSTIIRLTGYQKPFEGFGYDQYNIEINRSDSQCFGSSMVSTSQGPPGDSDSMCGDMNELSRLGYWEDHRAIVDYATCNIANAF